MNCIERLTVVLACALAANCSSSSENPLAGGLTPEQEALLIELTIDQIESTENFNHENFEQLQRKHLETMTEEMRDVARENLKKRLEKIMILEMSQTVELDRASAEVDWRVVDLENVVAIVTLNGGRSYSTSHASNVSETQFSLPWAVSVDGGELVFRHRGIRMRNTRTHPATPSNPPDTEPPASAPNEADEKRP